MRERLEQFLKSEGLTSTRFAEMMDVQPSSISHILGGRNKPSYDFIEKILGRFPRLNPDWLILGKGEMFRSGFGTRIETEAGNNFGIHEFNEITHVDTGGDVNTNVNNSRGRTYHNVSRSDSRSEPSLFSKTTTTTPEPTTGSNQNQLVKSDGTLKRIILIYDDETFSILDPKK